MYLSSCCKFLIFNFWMFLEIKAQISFNLFYNIIQVGVRTTKWHIILMFLIIITKLMMEFYDAKFMEIKKTNNGTILL